MLQKWEAWSGTPLHHADFADHNFITIEHIPDQARRQEVWELQYRRNPYMRSWSMEKVRERFDEVICISVLASLRASPYKPNKEVMISNLASMSHVMLEMGWRAIPVTEFAYSPDRLAAAGRRLSLGPDVIEWLERDCGRA